MKSAPSVQYPVGRSSIYGLLLVMLGVAIAIVLLLWLIQSAATFRTYSLLAGGVLLWSAWCAWSWLHWKRGPLGTLEWQAAEPSGRHETSSDAPVEGQWRWLPQGDSAKLLTSIRVVADLQSAMLISVRSGKSTSVPKHIWLQRSSDPQRWLDLRRSIKAHGH